MTADSVGQSRFERPPPLATIAPQPKRAAMTISMYQASVPVLVRALTNLKGILNKAAAHAQAKKIDEAVFLDARLSPDMFPLRRQVQIAADHA